MPYSRDPRALILDPLLGHPEASRHVNNLNLRGTIKELAHLDGGRGESRRNAPLVVPLPRRRGHTSASAAGTVTLRPPTCVRLPKGVASLFPKVRWCDYSVLFGHEQLVGGIIPGLWMMDRWITPNFVAASRGNQSAS
jgi:hypothetical protein